MAEEFHARDAESVQPLATALQVLGEAKIRTGKPDEAVTLFNRGLEIARAAAATQPEADPPRKRLAEFYDLLGRAYAETGQTNLALGYLLDELKITQRLAGQSSSHLDKRNVAIVHSRLSDMYMRMGRTQDARDSMAAALATFKQIFDAQPKDTSSADDYAQSLIGAAQLDFRMGRQQSGLDSYQQALAVYRAVVAREPNNAYYRRRLATALSELGFALLQVGQPGEAMKHSQEALNIRESLAEADKDSADIQRDLAIAYDDLADSLSGVGMYRQALDYYRKSFGIRRQLADLPEPAARAHSDLAISYSRLGDTHVALGELAEAAENHRLSLAEAEKALAADPANNDAHLDVAIAYYRLAAVRLGQAAEAARIAATQPEHPAATQPDALRREALSLYQNAAGHYEALAKDAGNAQARHDLAVTRERIGDLHMAMSQPEEAIQWFGKALAIARELATNKENIEAQALLAEALMKLGAAQSAGGKHEEALANLREAVSAARAVVAERPKQPDRRRELVRTLIALALAETAAGSRGAAAASYRDGLATLAEIEKQGQLDDEDREQIKQIELELKSLGATTRPDK